MATITVNIPDVHDTNLTELQEKLSSYAHYLAVRVKRKTSASARVSREKRKLSSIYGTLRLPKDTYESLRDKAMNEKFGL